MNCPGFFDSISLHAETLVTVEAVGTGLALS